MALRSIQDKTAFAGLTIPVAKAPTLVRGGKLREIPKALKTLLIGMKITGGYFFRPSKIITQQYPENRATLKMFDRYRAQLTMKYDERGFHTCFACKICERACPNGSIKVITRKGPVTGKIELDRYIWRMDSCIFCNNCVFSCTVNALEMKGDFETSVYDKRLLVFTLNKYAGPAASVLEKIENAEERKKMMEPRDRYGGPVPLSGVDVPANPVAGLKPMILEDKDV